MTTYKVARINANGLEQIAEALGRHHKLGRDYFTPAQLKRWAGKAEESFAFGNGMGFEIKSFFTNTGAPVEVTISAEGFDVEQITTEG